MRGRGKREPGRTAEEVGDRGRGEGTRGREGLSGRREPGGQEERREEAQMVKRRADAVGKDGRCIDGAGAGNVRVGFGERERLRRRRGSSRGGQRGDSGERGARRGDMREVRNQGHGCVSGAGLGWDASPTQIPAKPVCHGTRLAERSLIKRCLEVAMAPS